MTDILEMKVWDIRENVREYRNFEELVLDRIHRERLSSVTSARLQNMTARKSINEIIIDHEKNPTICGAIHESRDSLIDIRTCPNSSHACFHGENTIIPGMLIGAFLIKTKTGSLPFRHPGILFREMLHQDRISQKLYGVWDEDERFLTSLKPQNEYDEQKKQALERTQEAQLLYYRTTIRPYTKSFVDAVRKIIWKN